MNILYINTLIFRKGSSCAIRNVAMVKGLLTLGHSVDVLTIDFPDNLKDQEFIDVLKEAKILALPLNRFENRYLSNISLAPSKKKKNISRFLLDIIKRILFFPDYDKNWLKRSIFVNNLSKYDLCISASDTKTSHFMARKLLKRKDLKWIQYWGDPWADDINTPKYMKWIVSNFEKQLLNKATIVYYSSIMTTKLMKNKYKRIAQKMFDIEGVYLEEVIGEHFKQKPIKLVYTGVLSYGRNIYNLINAIEKINNNFGKTLFELNIYGSCSEHDFNKINAYSKAIRHHGQVSYKRINEIYKSNDVLVFLSNAIGCNQIPAKLYDYYGTNNAILSILYSKEDLLYEFLLSTNRSEICLNNTEAIEDQLNAYLNNCLKKYAPLIRYSAKNKAKEMLSR